jgi:hypothetical protein
LPTAFLTASAAKRPVTASIFIKIHNEKEIDKPFKKRK